MGEIQYHEPRISDDEMLAALTEADEGRVSVETVDDDDWQAQYSGIMEFRLGNGWKLAVFNDCYEWDYIEWVESPDGRCEEFSRGYKSETFTRSEVLQSWSPKHLERWGKNCPPQ
jgi:hypothetical protein